MICSVGYVFYICVIYSAKAGVDVQLQDNCLEALRVILSLPLGGVTATPFLSLHTMFGYANLVVPTVLKYRELLLCKCLCSRVTMYVTQRNQPSRKGRFSILTTAFFVSAKKSKLA